MQRPLYRGREHRWQRRPATGVRPTELAEDLTLAGDGGIETGREAEEVEHRGGIMRTTAAPSGTSEASTVPHNQVCGSTLAGRHAKTSTR